MLNRTGWVTRLPDDVLRRLCDCKSTMADLPILVNARWAWMRNQEKYRKHTKEDAVIYILELLESNSQYYMAYLTEDEYRELKREVLA